MEQARGPRRPPWDRNAFNLRGQRQDVDFYKARNLPEGAPIAAVVFAPGDGGWRGLALDIGETMSSWGYDVYGFDTVDLTERLFAGAREPKLLKFIDAAKHPRQ